MRNGQAYQRKQKNSSYPKKKRLVGLTPGFVAQRIATLISLNSRILIQSIIIKNDQPMDPEIVAVVDWWLLFRGHKCFKISN